MFNKGETFSWDSMCQLTHGIEKWLQVKFCVHTVPVRCTCCLQHREPQQPVRCGLWCPHQAQEVVYVGVTFHITKWGICRARCQSRHISLQLGNSVSAGKPSQRGLQGTGSGRCIQRRAHGLHEPQDSCEYGPPNQKLTENITKSCIVLLTFSRSHIYCLLHTFYPMFSSLLFLLPPTMGPLPPT